MVARLPVAIAVVLVFSLFLFAVQLLGTATETLAPVLRDVLRRIVVGDVPALGVAWLSSYVLGNGSVVAALALSLFAAGLLTPSQLFLMVAGSRLGAAAIVLFVGVLDYVQKGPMSLTDSIRLGVLAFILTYSIYLPATVLGYGTIPLFRPLLPRIDSTGLYLQSPDYFEPAAVALVEQVGGIAAFVLAILTILLSLELFDRVFDRVDREWLRSVVFTHFENRWIAFAVGVAVTAATTSVAFSLGIVVPLYNRKYVERSEVVPYVLGANIGTFSDTLLIAFVMASPVAIVTIVTLLGLSIALTTIALLRYDQYYEFVAAIHERTLTNRWTVAATIVLLILTPVGLALLR